MHTLVYRRERRRGLVAAAAVGAVAFLAAGVFAVVVAIGAIGRLDPFGSTTSVKPSAVVLGRVRDLASFDAATGHFQTVVDRAHTNRVLPNWISGDDTVLLAEGDVDATVDLSHLPSGAIHLAADGRSATVVLPTPTLGQPRLDPNATRVISRQRGLLDRVGDALGDGNPVAQDKLEQIASSKLSAAAAQSDLVRTAERNTTKFVTGSLRAAGVEHVTVTYAPTPA
ncbi:MAG TPA: DUF4230 domain-containing protein [Acidimicrobiales bacterium]|nr:DUF4230 domain-containing protein [Acidimicrobiales bacterium]